MSIFDNGGYIGASTVDFAKYSIVGDSLLVALDARFPESYSGSGSTWFDLSGNGRNATIVGSPTFTRPYFDDTSDSNYFLLSNSGLSPGTGDFTYSTWVMFDSSDANDSIIENGSWPDCILFRHESGVVTVYAENALYGTFTFAPTLGVWYNLVFRRSSYMGSMFVNGVPTATSMGLNVNLSIANTRMFLCRSQHATGQSLDGKISNFYLYSRSLTTQEIENNYNAQRGALGV